jgi:oxygen-independent coproporphyrinogen III oxidase
MNPRTHEPLNPIPRKIPGLYIHIPFCLKKCDYCSFYSVPSLALVPDFLEALFQEMERVCDPWGPFDTVYLGGGTPSVLALKQIESILTRIRKRFVLLPGTEMTLEANPGDLNLSFLRGLREIGINRLNLGIQSFDRKVLDFLGRRHSVEQAILAIENSCRAGFQNMGLDLIYGIPGQEIESWQETLGEALLFSPEHLSCYQLTLEDKTPLGRRYRKGEFQLPEETLQYDLFMKTSEWLEAAGYLHYEVSNFARGPASASRHNQKYWNHTPYLGLGPAAHSFKGIERWWNHPSLDQYLVDLKEGRSPVHEKEVLTLEQLRLEALFLGLRTLRGISLKDFERDYQSDLLIEKKGIISKLQEEGFLSIREGALLPTRAGLAIADSLALI